MKLLSILLATLFLSACFSSTEKARADSDIFLQIASEYFSSGNAELALAEADKAIDKYSQNYYAHFLKAEVYISLKDYNSAKASVDAGTLLLPEDKLYLAEHWQGVLFLSAGNSKKAAELFAKTMQQKPDYVENLSLYCQALTKLGKRPECIVPLTKWIAAEPKSSTPHEQLGMIYIKTGKYEKAEQELNRAVTLNPKSGQAHHYLGRLFEAVKRYEEAEKNYLLAIELNAPADWVRMSLGQLYMGTGRDEEAKPYLEEVIKLNPSIHFSYYWLGKYYTRKDDHTKAASYYLKSIEMEPNFMLARISYADAALQGGGSLEMAKELLLVGTERQPNAPQPHFFLAKIMAKENRPELALGHIEDAFKFLPPEAKEAIADLHLLKGHILDKQGKKAEAKLEYETAVKIAKSSPAGKEAGKLLGG